MNESKIVQESAENSSTTDSEGIRLLKKGKRGILHLVFSRIGVFVVLLALQFMLIVGVYRMFNQYLPHFIGIAVLFSIFMVLFMINSDMDSTAKMAWIFIIMLLPIVGGFLYFFVKANLGQRTLAKRAKGDPDAADSTVEQDPDTWNRMCKESPDTLGIANYVKQSGNFPVYENTSVQFFPMGEDKFAEMLKQLKEAKYFIFMEYFIIDEGLMWGKLLEILAEKVKEGVEVRVMYDGMCEFSTLPANYPALMKKLGINCKMFSPLTPFVSSHYNYRDHRKILVIDGHTAFTGGVNLADEYINHIDRFGVWKDTAIMLKGDAVTSFTRMFLLQWNVSEKVSDYGDYLNYPTNPPANTKGFVIPYGDNPTEEYKVGENVYIDILNRANDYVHIMTPYLILDGETENALKLAAQRGVDVKLILPGVPDKPIPYALAKGHYRSLMAAGVKIYEFTPGFVHAKLFVSDDCKAVVGTINLDYRSLYHHFECAAYMYGTDCIGDISSDFSKTLERCAPVTTDTIKHEKKMLKLEGFLIKLFAPML